MIKRQRGDAFPRWDSRRSGLMATTRISRSAHRHSVAPFSSSTDHLPIAVLSCSRGVGLGTLCALKFRRDIDSSENFFKGRPSTRQSARQQKFKGGRSLSPAVVRVALPWRDGPTRELTQITVSLRRKDGFQNTGAEGRRGRDVHSPSSRQDAVFRRIFAPDIFINPEQRLKDAPEQILTSSMSLFDVRRGSVDQLTSLSAVGLRNRDRGESTLRAGQRSTSNVD
ncbi:hypothetical protein AAFF_G00407640 [Aldrovandia affinis]|uniref:Uncharacterized protein n=1 Tax=Aldrovandia affinis TaxID=143900 RepID=A0AAD7WKS6_9TELE|nr:hypothetical protein AAFF_G00407640 [Aldrovandia affinis]